MAANDILVYKFDRLEGCSAQMGDVVQAIDSISDIAKKIKDDSSLYWQGDAYDAFTSRFSDLIGAFDKLKGQINTSKEKLDKAIALERQNEEELKTKTVGRLSADNIF